MVRSWPTQHARTRGDAPGQGTTAPAYPCGRQGRPDTGDAVSFSLPDEVRGLFEPAEEDVYGLEEISVNGGTVVRRAQEGLGAAAAEVSGSDPACVRPSPAAGGYARHDSGLGGGGRSG
ncbi:hypothetical protein [Streptomyces barringtoniae]|uniref:hypothetical protein n=1 Tax=Streptomyces barringtoniae TaxID=2892029 RepID=UPI001E31E218|nr:hypothetical protein [Streptomyces barringtoniae]MCC5478238.1 hypothetical protein [Streptomyces barringtoniae]